MRGHELGFPETPALHTQAVQRDQISLVCVADHGNTGSGESVRWIPSGLCQSSQEAQLALLLGNQEQAKDGVWLACSALCF